MKIMDNIILFPRCGLSLGDLRRTAKEQKTKTDTARRLGVSVSQLDRILDKYELQDLFNRRPGEMFLGLTATEILRAARECNNATEAAKALGRSPDTFRKNVKLFGLGGYFKSKKIRKRKVTRRQIIQLARQGYTRRDTAFLLDISPAYLKDLIALWDISHEFAVSKGKAAWVTRRGYCYS